MYGYRKEHIVCILGYIALFASLIANSYLIPDATFMIGICLLPFIMYALPRHEKSMRFLPIVLVFFAGSFYVREVSFRYLTLLFATLFAMESLSGKVSPLVFWLLLIISPLFKYLSEIFTFPIRLQLSKWAGLLLQTAHFPATVTGNIIQVNGSDFSVDPACMGLQMTGFSLLAGIFLLVHFQKSTGKELPWYLSTLVIAILFGFNIVSNLLRIVVLVVFSIGPENILHDVVGILCLVLYVWLPASFFVKYFFRFFAQPVMEQIFVKQPGKPTTLAFNFIILAGCCFVIFQNKKINIGETKINAFGHSEKYDSSQLSNGASRFKSEKSLVYLKPIPAFYSTDHSPYTCWKGSGYEFANIREENFAGRRIYFGTLKKGNDVLHTAWWFSNNNHITISQIDWRWKVIRGEPGFQLVNVTAGDQKDLKQAISEWMPRI
ncbi:exosortase N [Dyadobacter pollutisoli]|uniref:Exosortase N n=1 Tax=Dyadobacter pollutisoli TaxID=2910158 RepID=A0A9E8N945_9BACT|nr:exosortase N [Dyadobacter pollutisoli]WAC10197.1 exosortase N [Dyadobacter pollutisoli]